MSEIITSSEVIGRYLGIPFLHMGRDPKMGLDCYGLIKCVYRDFLGVDLLDIEEYSKYWFLNGEQYFMDNYTTHFDEVKDGIPKLFDVVLFNCSHGEANHAGIVLDRMRFIHANRAGVTVNKFTQRYWKDRTVGFFRLKGQL